MDLPELKDIPRSGKSGKNLENLPGDTTISSADEEGDELFDDEDLNEEDISPLEKKLLKKALIRLMIRICPLKV